MLRKQLPKSSCSCVFVIFNGKIKSNLQKQIALNFWQGRREA